MKKKLELKFLGRYFILRLKKHYFQKITNENHEKSERYIFLYVKIITCFIRLKLNLKDFIRKIKKMFENITGMCCFNRK